MRTKRGGTAFCRAWRMIAEKARAKNVFGLPLRSTSRTEIRIETHETLVIRPLHGARIAWCGSCRIEVHVLTPAEAAAFARTTQREIYRKLEVGSLHAVKLGDDVTFVCWRTGINR